MNEINVKNIGNDQYAIKIVNTLIELRHLIESAEDAYDENGEAIAQLHLARTDIEHMMGDTYDEDPVRDALIQQNMTANYRAVLRRRRELITEDQTLDILFESGMYDMIDDVLERMTGQMQFVDHAYYVPKSKICGDLMG